MSELVTVIIVSYNNWPDLELAIQSALHQSYPKIEVIVVDNGSTDETAHEVSHRFGGSIRLIQQPNLKEAGGRNTGFHHSRGEFIQFLDGDDFLAPNKIEKQMQTFRNEPEVDIVYGEMRHFQTVAGYPQWKDWDAAHHEDMLATLGSELAPHSILFRRAALQRIGPWDNSLYFCDLDYYLRAGASGCKFRFCPGSLCFYRKRPGQITADLYQMMLGQEETWTKALTYIKSQPYHGEVARKLARTKYHRALYPGRTSGREARKLISGAHSLSKDGIPARAVFTGLLLVTLPGGRRLASKTRSPWLFSLRRRISGWLGVKEDSTIEAG